MRTLAIITVSALIALGLWSCRDYRPKDNRTDTRTAGTIGFVADESFRPIVEEEVQVFQNMCFEAKLKPKYTNEVDAINQVLKGTGYLAITSRRFSDKEIANMKERNLLPITIPIAYDGLALIVNNANPDSVISLNEFKDILTGRVAKWGKLRPGSALGDIEVAFDNPQSSTVRYCVDSLLSGRPINSPNIYAVKKSAEVIDFVEHNKNAIGIVGSNWLNDKRDTTNVTFKRNIKVLKVSRIHPATATSGRLPFQYYLLNGEYPLCRTIYALLNDPHNGLPSGFADFVAGPKGQLVILKAGLLPYRGDIQVRQINVNQSED